jgi:hypothetical protein
MQTIYTGVVGRGFQFASGEAVGRKDNPSPFSKGTLELQKPHFERRGIDLETLVPGLRRGTINLELSRKLILRRADYVASLVDWTQGEETRIPPETFSFVRCCFVYPLGDGSVGYYPGLLYYPHPETKPTTNRHNFDALEVLTRDVAGLAYGTPASVICRADAFEEF